MINLKLTRGEVSHLFLLVLDNMKDGSYYLSQTNWDKQNVSLRRKLEKALDGDNK